MNEEVRRLTDRLREIDLERGEITQRLSDIGLEVVNRGTNHPRDRAVAGGDSQERYFDCDGNILTIGDRVRFLTKGIFRSRYGTIVKFGKKRASCVDDTGIPTNRAYKNIRLITELSTNEQ